MSNKLNDNTPTNEPGKKKKLRIARLKQFLISNKIFFETIMTLSLSIAGVVLAYSSNKIARIQNEISAAQRDIEIESASPIIDLESEYDENGDINKVDVINSGGLLDTAEVEIYPYVRYEMILLEGGKDNIIISNSFDRDSKKEYCRPVLFGGNDFNEEIYKTYTPHIKTGVLLSIQLSNLGKYIKDELSQGLALEQVYLDSNGCVVDSSSEHAYSVIVPVSFEYLISIEYSSLVNDDIKTEIFKVIPGIGAAIGEKRNIKKIDINKDEYSRFDDILNGSNSLVIPKELYKEVDKKRVLHGIQNHLVENSEFTIVKRNSTN